MDILELIKQRRSIRSFKSDEIPKEDIDKLLEAAQWAPSAGNRQPVEIVIIQSLSQKEKLVANALDQRFIQEAPLVLVVCADLNRSSARYGERGSTLYAIQDAAAATQNILLAATAMGYGSVWIGAFLESDVAKTLELPSNVRPLSIIPIGKTDKTPVSPRRRSLTDFVHKEKFI